MQTGLNHSRFIHAGHERHGRGSRIEADYAASSHNSLYSLRRHCGAPFVKEECARRSGCGKVRCRKHHKPCPLVGCCVVTLSSPGQPSFSVFIVSILRAAWSIAARSFAPAPVPFNCCARKNIACSTARTSSVNFCGSDSVSISWYSSCHDRMKPPCCLSAFAIFLTISSGTCSKCVLGLGVTIPPFQHRQRNRPEFIRVNSLKIVLGFQLSSNTTLGVVIKPGWDLQVRPSFCT